MDFHKCSHCCQEFRQGEKPYRSRQAGMRGWYHWSCFISACRQANEIGQKHLITILEEGRTYGEEEGHLTDLSGTSALLN